MTKSILSAVLAAALLLVASSSMAQAAVPNTATITFVAPTTHLDGTPITAPLSFNVYQGVKGATKAKVGTVTTNTAVVSSGLLSNTQYCWQVTALEGTAESAMSNEACKPFGASPPGVVTITVQ